MGFYASSSHEKLSNLFPFANSVLCSRLAFFVTALFIVSLLSAFKGSPAVPTKFPPAVFPFCFFPCPLLRTGSDETDGQETGEDGHHTGIPAAVHPATGPAASGPRGSPDPSAPHARYSIFCFYFFIFFAASTPQYAS